jgi:hypothetical protein
MCFKKFKENKKSGEGSKDNLAIDALLKYLQKRDRFKEVYQLKVAFCEFFRRQIVEWTFEVYLVTDGGGQKQKTFILFAIQPN